jgi:hypothetical protein
LRDGALPGLTDRGRASIHVYEHVFQLRQVPEFYDFYQQQIHACDREIKTRVW